MIKDISPKVINLVVLVSCVLLVLFMPFRKEVWYDETISMMCSKGLNPNSPIAISEGSRFSSAEFHKLNTISNVFTATVVDNSNSFLYNACLHWFTSVFGNSVSSYMLLSQLLGALTLIVVFLMATSFFGHNLFVSLAVLLLYLDVDFMGMSHEIRAYIMGMLLSALAGLSFFKFINDGSKTINLFFTALLSVAALLTHFLSVYIVLVLLLSILIIYKKSFFSLQNILALILPILLIAIFFYYSLSGIQIMSSQNVKIKAKAMAEGFSYVKVLFGTLKFISLNFKLVFPAFINRYAVSLISVLSLFTLYFFAFKHATSYAIKRNLHLLFLLGISSSIFLALLCVKSGHYTALYYRYHSFSIPFSTLFVSYALWILWSKFKNQKFRIVALVAIFMLPCGVYYAVAVKSHTARLSYNHMQVAATILKNNVTEIEVPDWGDAYLIHSVMPADCKVDYVRNKVSTYFTLKNANGSVKIEKLAKDN